MSSHRHAVRYATIALMLGAVVPFVLAGCKDAVGAEEGIEASLVAEGQLDLTGTWQLNEEESDGLQRPNRPRGPGGPDGHRGPRGGSPGGGPPRGPGGRGEPLAAFRTLEISQTATSVTFTMGRRSHTFETDGQARTHSSPRGEQIQVRAWWGDAGLVIERAQSRGTLTQTYSLSEDAQKLYEDVRIEGERFPEGRELRRVFDRVTDGG